ncbi:hypothetical protein NEIRO03_2560 [Nematocida sp. AWRm78]|nr:hypothetical protein NEIRO02_2541 [Nematocida sp. AWRm79]KAI5187535.1 hypothetical protein NEIRO03_2560 [Nematocida sp. AWRm78]
MPEATKRELRQQVERIEKTQTVEIAEINTPAGQYASEYRSMTPDKRAIAESIITELVAQGFMEETTPGKWLIPTRLTRKPNGSWRFCLDLKRLNELVAQDNYPLPDTQEIFNSMYGKKVFSVLDISNGFFRVPLRKEDRVKTTCKVGNRSFRMKALPMGFKNSPAIFQRIMDTMLKAELETGNLKVYIDDILIATETYREHVEVLKRVLRTLKEHGMEINWDKVRIAQREIKILGHILSENRLRPLDERITEIMKMPVPRNQKQVRSFLGRVNYMGRHIRDLSELKAPLNDFTRKGKEFVWEEVHQEAFMNLKSAVAKAIAAVIPDPNKMFTLETDASGTGMGATLKQGEEVIGYYSTRLSATQQRYTITERELLAVMWAMNRCKQYLMGKHFEVITDHKAIESYFTKKDQEFGNDRISRWMQAIENYDFTPKYRRGEDMIIADDLSRMYEGPSYESAPPNCEAIIMALQLEMADKVLKLHEELHHRKTISKDLESRGIKISAKELRDIMATCRTCLERDNQFSKHNAYIDTSAPGELMGIDLMTYQKGYVLVMIDYYTRMAFAQNLVRKDANSVLSVIKKIFTQFPFKKIIADHGREFDNTTIQAWGETNQVEIYYRPAYYHQGTGRIKRLIQTLRKALNRTKGPLRVKLGSVVKGYNRTVHRAIGTSPEMAMDPSRHAAVNEAVERYKLEFGKSKEPPLQGGQRVLVRKDIRHKDDKHFEEEGVVSEKQGFNSYLVKLQDGTDVIKNRSQLKPLD